MAPLLVTRKQAAASDGGLWPAKTLQ